MNGFLSDGTLIVKDGAGLMLDGGEGDVVIGDNVSNTPAPDLHTVVDISGPGSRVAWRSTDQYLQYGLDIGGLRNHRPNSAKRVTVNISDGGSFVFDHPNAGYYSIGEAADVKLNITGAGSQMALIAPVLFSVGLPTTAPVWVGTNHLGNWDTNLQLNLGRGGVFEFSQDTTNTRLYNAALRFTIGDDGTGRAASGLFRIATAYTTDGSNFALAVDPCTKLKPGDQFLLAEYLTLLDNVYGVPLASWVSDGKAVTIPNAGQYTNQGYTFTINYMVPLGYNYPRTPAPALGMIATVTSVPSTPTASCSASVQLVTGSDASSAPFALTGAGCAPGLYSGMQTLFVKPYSTCRIQHHPQTINGDNTAWRFAKWPDGATGPDRTVAMTDLAGYQVAIMQKQFRLWASASPSNGGTIEGQGYFDAGSYVTVIAVPAPSFLFTGWDYLGVRLAPATTTFKLTQPWYLKANFLHTMTPALLSVPDVAAWVGQTIKLKADLTTAGMPPLPAGALWGTLKFDVNGIPVRTINVYGPGWYQADYAVPSGSAYRLINATFTPSAAGAAELTGSTASGVLGVQTCPLITTCQ